MKGSHHITHNPEKKIHHNFIETTFLYYGPLPFSTIPSLLCLSTQNPLDYVSEFIRLQKI